MKPEVSKDLILLVNSLKDFVKSKSVKYNNTSFEYVPLDDLLDRIKQNDKWAVMQPLTSDELGSYVETVLIHETGEEVRSGKFKLLLGENKKMQDMGAVITYTKRYCLGAFLGIATETDNDANPDSEVKDIKPKVELINDVQIQVIKKMMNEERIAKMLETFKISNIHELSNTQALKVIEGLKKEQQK